MKIFKTAEAIKSYVETLRNKELTIGFVPTMGALHAGHITLVEQALLKNDRVICSIFVNPTQFNNAQDFELYPITIEDDLNQLEASGCHAVFLPTVQEIYPPGYKAPHYNLGYLETILEGYYRPGHFQGVCQVVDRLLSLISPDVLFLGSKDFQQCKVLEKMVELKGYPTKLAFVPTLRESDGLAMSSRNRRLNPTQRTHAALLYKALQSVANKLDIGDVKQLITNQFDYLNENGFSVDYLEIASADNLEILQQWNGEKAVILVAAYLDNIRLIDNIEVAGLQPS